MSKRRRSAIVGANPAQPVAKVRETRAPSIPAGHVAAVGIHVSAIVLRALEYRELSAAQSRLTGTSEESSTVELSGQINIYDSDAPRVELKMQAKVRPDLLTKPIELDTTIGAIFTCEESVSLGDLVRFVNEGGARVVFPYIRELVSAATARGIYGPVFLDPVTLGPLASEKEVVRLLSEHEHRRTSQR